MTAKPDWHTAARDLYTPGEGIKDDSNAARAARVLQAIYPAYDDWTVQAAVGDVLCDLRHLCDLMHWSLAKIDEGAKRIYQDEKYDAGLAEDDTLRTAVLRDLEGMDDEAAG